MCTTPPVEIDAPLGSYRLRWSAEGGVVHIERELILRERIVPPERYGELKRFFDAILAAERRPAAVRAPTG
jgi:hypothetical protein